MLWTMPSAALRSCFLSHINDTRLSMDKFQQALAGVFVRGSFPPVGTNPRLPVLPGEAERLGRELGARLKEEQAHG